jgi:hypothetical protein
MPRMEFQISTPVLLDALQQLLEPRLYAQCFVSPIPGLYLDHIEVGVQGPITQSSDLGSAALNVALSAKVFVVTADEVQAAQGGPPVSSLTPDGVPLTANIVASISGTKFTATYHGIVHDAFYSSLEGLVGGYVGGLANAKQFFSNWEKVLKQALAATSLINFDFEDVFPSMVKNLTNGRSALCADSKIVAARFEVGANGSDGSWEDFYEGKPGDLIGDHKWGLFISGDVLVDVVNGLVREAVSRAIAGFPFAVTGTFGLLAGSGPLAYSPLEPIAPKTGSVTTSATIDYNLSVTTFGITTTDPGKIQFIATLIFTVTQQNVGLHTEPSLDISLYYTVQNNLGGFLGSLAGFFGVGVSPNLPPLSEFSSRFSGTPFPNFFISQTALPTVAVEKVLTLTVSGCTGTVEPPVSPPIQQLIDSLSTGTLDGWPVPVGWEIFAPGSGLLIFGQAAVAAGKSRPDCGVSSTPFSLLYIDNSGTAAYHPGTPEYVPAVGTFSVYNKGPHPSKRYALIVGGFFPFADPTAQWYQAPSLLPPTPIKAGNFVVTIPEAQFRPAYMAAPYPLSLIVCTNGGARFVSLGGLTAPEIDPANGTVLNANVVVILGPGTPWTGAIPGSSGPHHPITSNKAPGEQ